MAGPANNLNGVGETITGEQLLPAAICLQLPSLPLPSAPVLLPLTPLASKPEGYEVGWHAYYRGDGSEEVRHSNAYKRCTTAEAGRTGTKA